MNARTGPTALQRAGLGLFFIGLALFVGTLGLAGHRVLPGALDALVADGAVEMRHRDALATGLAPLVGKSYRSVFPFLRDVGRGITRANENLDDANKIWSYQRGEYEQALARATSTGVLPRNELPFFLGTIVLASLGAGLYFLERLRGPPGIENDGVVFDGVKSRGVVGIGLGLFLILFYVALYFYPAYISSWIRLADPVSQALRGRLADRWFFYGMVYTFAILVMGLRMLIHYRHSRYHLVRTVSVAFFQLGFAFLIPAVLAALNRPEYDFKNIWPLDYSFFFGYRLDGYTSGGALGWLILFWGIGLVVIVVPLLTYFLGKRWYCSWVCGCGGLAETLGDPFRHLSHKGLRAWRVERWMVHGVLILALGMTAIVLINHLSAQQLLGQATWRVQSWYGFWIGSLFAGVVGVGFYPLMGNRVWCRFGCPLAAILGIVQRFKSRFRITTNGGQCISCGNCSTYCEMGIDVRWYAQRGQNVVRASCVGCGICASVFPRGVLRLENGPESGRFDTSVLLRIGD
jgi:Pyruvate/2-oxoacid:ferredoxin oxidoreductase delta subunit